MAKRQAPPKAFSFGIQVPKATLHDLRSVRLQRRTNRLSPSPSSSEDKVAAVSNMWTAMKGRLSPHSTDVSLDNSLVVPNPGRRLVELLKAESNEGSRGVGRSQRLLYRPHGSSPSHSNSRREETDAILSKALLFAVAVSQTKTALNGKSRSPRAEGATAQVKRERRIASNME